MKNQESMISMIPQHEFNRLILSEDGKLDRYLDVCTSFNHLLQKTQIDLTTSDLNNLIIEQKNETFIQKDLCPANQKPT